MILVFKVRAAGRITARSHFFVIEEGRTAKGGSLRDRFLDDFFF